MYDPVLGSNRKVIRPTGFDIIDFKYIKPENRI